MFCLLVAIGFPSPSGFGVVRCRFTDLLEGSPSDAERDRHPTAVFCNPFLGAVRGGSGTGECVVPRPRGVSGVQGGSACGPSTLWGSEVAVLVLWCSVSLLSRWVCAEGCFHIVFDFAGSAGVMSGSTLVVGHCITLFRYFFLLLWLVRDWLSLPSLVREAHPPTLFRWLAFQQGSSVSCKRVLLLLLGAYAMSMVSGSLVLRLSSSSACASVWVCREVGVFARGKQMLVCRVAPLVECCYTCLWLLSALCWLVVNSCKLLPEFFSVGSGGSENGLLLSGWLVRSCGFSQSGALVVLVEVLPGPACVASEVLLAAVFSLMVRVVGRLGRLLALLVEVLPKAAFVCGAFDRMSGRGAGQVVSLIVIEFLSCAGGTSCVPVVEWFASFLVPYVLFQMVVWRASWVFGWLCLSWDVVTFMAKASFRCVFCLYLNLCFGGFGADHEDDLGEIEWCRWTLHSIRGEGVVVTTGKSWPDLAPLSSLFFSFLPSLLFSEVGELPLFPLRWLGLGGAGVLVAEHGSGVVERGGGGQAFVKALFGFDWALPVHPYRLDPVGSPLQIGPCRFTPADWTLPNGFGCRFALAVLTDQWLECALGPRLSKIMPGSRYGALPTDDEELAELAERPSAVTRRRVAATALTTAYGGANASTTQMMAATANVITTQGSRGNNEIPPPPPPEMTLGGIGQEIPLTAPLDLAVLELLQQYQAEIEALKRQMKGKETEGHASREVEGSGETPQRISGSIEASAHRTITQPIDEQPQQTLVATAQQQHPRAQYQFLQPRFFQQQPYQPLQGYSMQQQSLPAHAPEQQFENQDPPPMPPVAIINTPNNKPAHVYPQQVDPATISKLMVEQMIEMKLSKRGDGELVPFDVYRVPYPPHHAMKKLPLGMTKPPKFDKFNRQGSPKEHIAHYINVMGDLAANESYLLKFFGSSLTGLAFEWYSGLPARSVLDWADMQKKFRERFYIAEREVIATELYATKQKANESTLDYIQRWRNL
ncbi:hypothetical protein Taro_051277, partial [Colocasia esculenta]|nr:hypothetical protein [Colocasia esculenta]